MYDVEEIRSQFPILAREVYGRPLVYLDNAATTQKPRCVIDAISHAYCTVNANVHRGVHRLSQEATALHEGARETVRRFIGAASTREVLFTRGTTEGINLLAYSFGEVFLHEGDEVIISEMEHHSNIVPWQLLRERKGIVLRVIPMTDAGTLDMDGFRALLNERTRLVSVAYVSNVLGTINPVEEVIRISHAHGIPVCIDGAQSAPHLPVDVQALDCDFYAFSAHKVYGPTGVGVLYGKEQLLEQMPPYQGGGEMIEKVTFPHTTFNELPYTFEAGTPDFIGTTATAVALDYVSSLGLTDIAAHETSLTAHAIEGLRAIPGVILYGPAAIQGERGGAVVSFNVEGVHPSDIGTLLDHQGVAVRTGHHCAQPLMDRLGITGTVRASFGAYNTMAEVDIFLSTLERAVAMLK
jgi:cysteine desulfurase/selenocysteine lyase